MNIPLTGTETESQQYLISKLMLAKTRGNTEVSIPENGFTDEMKDWLTRNGIPYSYNSGTFEFEINLTENN
jgi:hypothetical protein